MQFKQWLFLYGQQYVADLISPEMWFLHLHWVLNKDAIPNLCAPNI